jgi:hypothetical protein
MFSRFVGKEEIVLHTRNVESNGNMALLQPHPVVAVDAVFEISTAMISAVLSLDEHLS